VDRDRRCIMSLLLRRGIFSGSFKEMVTTWNTENLGGTGSATKVILLPMTAGPSVDWGDGTVNNLNTHTYSVGGVKTVKIYGNVAGWTFFNLGDKLKITDVSNVGGLFIDGIGSFYGCANLVWSATNAPNIITSMSSCFRGCTIFNGDVSKWNVSNVMSTVHAFRDTAFNKGIGSWDVGLVTSMNSMFRGSPFNQDLSLWQIGNVDNVGSMFRDAINFDQDISSWDIASVTTAANFLNGSAFTQTNYDLLLPAWEAQSVQNNVVAHFGAATYGAGAPATARAALIADHTWTITDGGAA